VNTASTEAVRDLLRTFMRKWLDDVPDPAQQELEGLVAPFHDSLVPGIRLLNERSFSTRLGNLHERVAQVIAEEVHAEVRQPLDLTGTIPVLSREFITQRISQLERRQASPDAPYERDQIRGHFGNEVQAGTRIDLWLRTHEGTQHFFEIKSGKPNKGQCIEMKERLLTAFAVRRNDDSHWWWGVPYSPFGSGLYRHSYALPFFDFANEVKMGSDFWDFIGGVGSYEQLLAIYVEVGEEFAPQIEALRER
jgi:hypothetical protein